MRLTKKTIILIGVFLSLVLVILLLPFGARFFRDTEALKAKYLQRGQEYFAERQYEAAIIEWKNAVQLDPKFALAYYKLGKAYTEQGLIKWAFAALIRSVNLDPNLLEAQLDLGGFYVLAAGDEPLLQAEQIAQLVLDKDPQQLRAHLLLSQVALERKDYEQAFAAVNQALQLQPDDLTSRLHLAMVHWRNADVEQAEATLRQAIDQHATEAEPYFQIGRFYQFTNRLVEAEPLFRQGVQIEPENPQALYFFAKYFDLAAVPDSALYYMRQANQFDPEVLLYKKHLAFYLTDRGQVEEASQQLADVQRQDPDDVDSWYFQGRLHLLQNEDEAALEILEKVAFQRVDYAFDWYGKDLGYFLAVAQQRNGQTRDAIQSLNYVEPAVAQRKPVRIFSAQLHLALGNVTEGLDKLRLLRQEYPADESLLLLEAQALSQSADPTEQLEGLKVLIGRLQQVVAQAPQNLSAAVNLSNFLLRANRAKEAEAVLLKALEQNPQAGDLLVVLGNLYIVTGVMDKAQARYLEVIEQEPEHFGAYHQLGQYYALMGDLAKAREHIEKSLQLKPDYLPAQKNLAFIQLQQNEVEVADAFAQTLLKQRADDPDGLYLQGLAQLNKGETEETLDSFLRIRATNPDYRFAPFATQIQHPMALAYFRSGQFSAGLKTAEAILKDDPNNLNALLLRANALLQLKRFDQALAGFNKVIELYPAALGGYYGAGEIYMRQGKMQEAVLSFEYILQNKADEVRALEFAVRLALATGQGAKARQYCQDQLASNPAIGMGHYWLGHIEQGEGNLVAAEEQMLKALALEEQQPRWHFSLGGLYLQLEKYQQAQASFERALELAPKYAEAANNLAWLLAEKDIDLNRAQRLATMAQRLAPDNADILDTLGWIHLKNHSYGTAIRLFEKGISAYPDKAILHYHLGVAYLRRDDSGQARQALERFLDLDPTHAEADSAQFYLNQLTQL